MRRHERPRQINIRVELPENLSESDWCGLSLAHKRTHIAIQLKSLGPTNKQPQMKCLCGLVTPIMFAYRCYECGAFWCPKCAGKHFDKVKRKMNK